jgi:23S rRNA (cytidine1920-2'-O)/16S rRNA (cytidine1409-2'-O)-methyltransferase
VTGAESRLDLALVRRGLAPTRTRAQALIGAGRVTVNGAVARRPAASVTEDDAIVAVPEPYVSRAAHKLLGALQDLDLEVGGRRALDAGASTGGFTQVLLELGCPEVIAVDVGTDQLDPLIRSDPRVQVWERTNLRALTLDHVGGRPVDLVVADVSFISLRLLVEPLLSVLVATGDLLVMIKPQFEVGRTRLGNGGVVRDAALHDEAVAGVLEVAAAQGWGEHRVVPSRLPGQSGNREFFALIRRRT